MTPNIGCLKLLSFSLAIFTYVNTPKRRQACIGALCICISDNASRPCERLIKGQIIKQYT